MALKLGSNINLDKVVKNLGQKYKLVPHIDLAISKGEFEWEFKHKVKQGDDAWHPSGDCVPSVYDLWLKTQKTEDPHPLPVSLIKTFMVGHFWHQYLQWIVQRKLEFAGPRDIERRGIKIWGSTRVSKKQGIRVPDPYHWATGAGDIAPCVIPGVGTYAVDFKTMNARMFATGPPPDYLAKWECQGNIYLDFFDLEQIIFIGICKDSPHDMKEWIFTRNQPLIDAIYRKWKLVSACLDEGVEPPRDEHIDLPLQGVTQ